MLFQELKDMHMNIFCFSASFLLIKNGPDI